MVLGHLYISQSIIFFLFEAIAVMIIRRLLSITLKEELQTQINLCFWFSDKRGDTMDGMYEESAVDLENNSVWVGSSKYSEEDTKRLEEYAKWKKEWSLEVRKRKSRRTGEKIGIICSVISFIGLIYLYYDLTTCHIELGRITVEQAVRGTLFALLISVGAFCLGRWYHKYMNSKQRQE